MVAVGAGAVAGNNNYNLRILRFVPTPPNPVIPVGTYAVPVNVSVPYVNMEVIIQNHFYTQRSLLLL